MRSRGHWWVLAIAITVSGRADTPPGRYIVDSAAGTVVDTKTTLTWQQKSPTSGGTAGKNYLAGEAMDLCRGIDTGWRLPTIKELMTIADFKKATAPAIDTTVFLGEPADAFWSITRAPDVQGEGTLWLLDFSSGTMGAIAMQSFARVRCVK